MSKAQPSETGHSGSSLSSRRNTWYLDFGLKATFILVLLGFGFLAFRRGGVDYRGYHAAALLVLRGGNPYDYGQLAPVLEEIAGFQSNNPFFYPPWFVIPFLPMAVLPFQVARALWLAINLVLFVVSVGWIRQAMEWELTGWRRWLTYLAAFLTFGAFCLMSEQAGILLLFGAALALRSIKADQPFLAGLGLVIMLSKPQATLIAVLALGLWTVLRKSRLALWAAGWLAALTLAASVLMPGWWNFETEGFGQGLVYQLQGPGQIEFKRLYATVYDFLGHALSLSGITVYIIAAAIGLVGLLVLVRAWRHYRDPVAITGTALLLGLLVTPYALQYDFVPLVILMFWLLMRSGGLGRIVRALVVIILLSVFGVLLWQEWSYQGYWQLLGMLLASIVVMTADHYAGRHRLTGQSL